MQKSYLVKSPINFANFGFFVRTGDVLVHNTANENRLTVYRGGEIVKVITHTALGMAALLKQNFVTELTHSPTPVPIVQQRAPEPPKKAPPVEEPKPDAEVLRKEIKKKAKIIQDQEEKISESVDEL